MSFQKSLPEWLREVWVGSILLIYFHFYLVFCFLLFVAVIIFFLLFCFFMNNFFVKSVYVQVFFI